MIESLLLGFVQGVTEFLPISSSGHLVIMQNLLGISEPQILFDVLLHVGTLAAILVVFRKDVAELARAMLRIALERRCGNGPGGRMLAAIAVGCIPTAVIGALFSEQFERMFASLTAAGVGLMVTGFLLVATTRTRYQAGTVVGLAPHDDSVRLVHALWIGAAQGLALTPGISRSGATIAVALLLGVPRELAARYSFLLAVPAVLGALLFELRDYSAANPGPALGALPMLLGALVAAVSGIAALTLLLKVVRRGKLSRFAYYCWTVGLLAIVAGMLRG